MLIHKAAAFLDKHIQSCAPENLLHPNLRNSLFHKNEIHGKRQQ